MADGFVDGEREDLNMQAFDYVARNADGRLVRSAIDAATRHDALASLRSAGLTVVDLTAHAPGGDASAVPDHARPAARTTRLRGHFGHVSRLDISQFCRQLAICVNAGLPIREALEALRDELERTTLRHVLDAVIQDLHDGATFSQSLARHPAVFGPLFVALVRSAEESGSMPQTLDNLATYLERADRLARKIRSILAYPVFVLAFFLVVCVVMTLFILPQFEDIFAENKAKLPALTRAVLGANRFFLDHIPLFLGGFAVLFAGLWTAIRAPSVRMRWDAFKLRIPFFGGCLLKYAVARITRTLGILLRGGVPITAAIEIGAGVCGNTVLEQSLARARERLLRGEDLATGLQAERVFPRLVVRMVGVGESSGQLPQVLDKVADGYEDQVEGSVMIATALFEPLVIVLLGGAVLILVLAIYFPIFTMARTLS